MKRLFIKIICAVLIGYAMYLMSIDEYARACYSFLMSILLNSILTLLEKESQEQEIKPKNILNQTTKTPHRCPICGGNGVGLVNLHLPPKYPQEKLT